MSDRDPYGPCPGCGVNVDPWQHDCPEELRRMVARFEADVKGD